MKSILKKQQMFNSERQNAFTEEINEIAHTSNDDKGMQSIDLIETCGYGTSKVLLRDKEEIKCNNKTIQKMIHIGYKFLIIHRE